MRSLRSLCLVCLASVVCGAALAADPKDLVVIPQSAQEILVEHDIPVIFKGARFFLAEWDASEQAAMTALRIPFEVILREVSPDQQLYMFELHPGEEPPSSWQTLYRSGLSVVVPMEHEEAERWAIKGHHPIGLLHDAYGWGTPRSLLVPYDCTHKPLIAEMLGKTTQAQWLDWIEKLSGAEPVRINGTNYTINTRHTATMFSGAANAKGYDFVRQQAQAWKFTGANLEEDSFTLGPGGKNLVLTIPGQNPTSEVLLTAHLDTIWQTGDSTTTAPGANDNGTGTATLLEAARLLRQYRFDRTIRIIFFTGEEQGLWGSNAYTDDHPLGGVAGVLNLDMFGYDANGDRCFEIHIGTLPASLDIGNCFNQSITTYGTNLTRDFLTTGATDRSDHASFWTHGVGAIEIAENFFSNGQAGGCVGSEPNPNYHTNNDRIAGNMHPPYAFSIGQTALATIAAMAVPLEACFAGGPTISAQGGVNRVEVSWAAVPGAGSYRVYRSQDGCGGTFISVGESAGTGFIDSLATPGSLAYKVEAIAPDGQCFSVESNCSMATPFIVQSAASYLDSCPSGGPGDGDGYLDPGEVVTLPVTLSNLGSSALTSVTGTLSSATPGISLLDPTASWPDLEPSTVTESLPDHFRFEVGSAMACGTDVDLGLEVTAAESGWVTAFASEVGRVLPANATVLNESFAGGIPATWTIVDGSTGGGAAATWTTANPGLRTFAPPQVAPVAIVDSDEAGSGVIQNEELITPVLDLTGATAVTLQFDQHFRWFSGGLNEKGDVDVRSSLTGGAWVNLLRNQGASAPNSTINPNTEHRTLDLTALAAGAPDVQIRFHYYDAQFEWWWMVDNVRVDVSLIPACEMTPCLAAGTARPVAQMTASRADESTIDVSWDVATCASTDHELLFGDLATVGSYSLSGSVCALGTTGTASWSGVPAGDLWFLVTGVSGTGTEASWGTDSTGNHRNAGVASGQCGNAARDDVASCP